MKYLMILNDQPYGSERSFNALRLAGSLAKRDGTEVKVFLMGDAVGCATKGQVLPDGYYHLDRMLTVVARHGGEIACCGTCMDARALAESALIKDAKRSTLDELTDWTIWADKVVNF